MTDRIIAGEYIDLGIIKIVHTAGDFPWPIFMDGEINCAFQFDLDHSSLAHMRSSMNDIRHWINENVKETVYLEYSHWSPCRLAFTSPKEALIFSIKFGNDIEKLK